MSSHRANPVRASWSPRAWRAGDGLARPDRWKPAADTFVSLRGPNEAKDREKKQKRPLSPRAALMFVGNPPEKTIWAAPDALSAFLPKDLNGRLTLSDNLIFLSGAKPMATMRIQPN
jgi:hypothetical protein